MTDAKRCFDTSDKYPTLKNEYNTLRRADPTQHLCTYMDWIAKSYLRKEFLLEDVERLKEDLTLFHKNKNRFTGTNKDINSFTYPKLKAFLQETFQPKIEFNQSFDTSKDIEVAYKGPYGELYVPLTEKGSCDVGSGTKWCTAAHTDNMFEQYHKKGFIYTWIDKQWNTYRKYVPEGPLSKKYQFHFESDQFMDELDNRIPDALLNYFRLEHPIIKQLFEAYETRILQDRDYEKIYKYARDVIKARWPQAENIIAENSYYAVKYSYEIAGGLPWSQINGDTNVDIAISRDPEAAVYLAQKLNQRLPESEPYILQNGEQAYIYNNEILKQDRWIEAEPAIMTDPIYASFYAINNLKRPWLEAEPYILQNANEAFRYHKKFHTNRWPEFEKIMLEPARYPEGEDMTPEVLMGETLSDYIIRFVRYRMPEAEPFIVKTEYAADYAIYILKARWREAEEAIASSDFEGAISPFDYATKLLGSYWIDSDVPKEIAIKAESAISYSNHYTDKYLSHFKTRNSYIEDNLKIIENHDDYNFLISYIKHVVKGELSLVLPEDQVKKIETGMRNNSLATYMKYITALKRPRDLDLEKQILIEKQLPYNIAEIFYKYARDIIKSRWYEIEGYILSSTSTIVPYCMNVIKTRWPVDDTGKTFSRVQAEGIIMRNISSATSYCINVLHERSIILEDKLKKNEYMGNIADYIEVFPQARNTEIEANMLAKNQGLNLAKYAHKIFKGRWLEAEPFIIEDTEAITYYMKNVTKDLDPIVLNILTLEQLYSILE
jgi:hypothetical protein